MGDIRLFVSHAHSDEEIAVALVDLIETAMVRVRERIGDDRDKDRILCTSHPDKLEYGYSQDVDVSEYLRQHLEQSACVVAVLTPHSLSSQWCLFELGGAWARSKETYPLLAGGLTQSDMPAALQRTPGAQLNQPEELQRVLDHVRRVTKWRAQLGAPVEQKIDQLVEIVNRAWPPA
jgi:hypothetical protein